MSRAEQDFFRKRVAAVGEAIEKELSRRHQEGKALEAANQGHEEAAREERLGMKHGDLGKMKGGDEQARREMAERQSGLSMEEIAALKGMSREDRKAWGAAHAGELPSRQAGRASPENAAFAADARAGGTSLQRLPGAGAGREGEEAPGAVRRARRLRRPERDRPAGEADRPPLLRRHLGRPGQEVRGVEKQLEMAKLKLCQRYTPQLRALLAEYRDFVTKATLEWDRIDADEAGAKARLTGAKPTAARGKRALECAKRYLKKLGDRAFAYDLTGGT